MTMTVSTLIYCSDGRIWGNEVPLEGGGTESIGSYKLNCNAHSEKSYTLTFPALLVKRLTQIPSSVLCAEYYLSTCINSVYTLINGI